MNAREELKARLVHEAHDRAVTLARRGRWREAEDELDAWSMLEPASPEVSLTRARIRYHQGRRQQSLYHLGQAAAAGADPATVERMRTDLVADDDRRTRRLIQKEEDRKARKAFLSDIATGVGEFFAGLSPREVVYLGACVIFIGYVMISTMPS